MIPDLDTLDRRADALGVQHPRIGTYLDVARRRLASTPQQAAWRPGGWHGLGQDHGRVVNEAGDLALETDAYVVPRHGQASTLAAPRRQRMPASMKSSRSPSKTALGLPDSWPVRRSLTIW